MNWSGREDGLSIPDAVDAVLTTKSDSPNWAIDRSQFLSVNAQAAYAMGVNNTSVSQISVSALKVIADSAQGLVVAFAANNCSLPWIAYQPAASHGAFLQSGAF